MQHEVVRQLLACLSHVGVSSKILQATPLQGSKATKPDQRAERLVNHFRRYVKPLSLLYILHPCALMTLPSMF